MEVLHKCDILLEEKKKKKEKKMKKKEANSDKAKTRPTMSDQEVDFIKNMKKGVCTWKFQEAINLSNL